MKGRAGPNNGWEYEEGWTEASLGEKLTTEIPKQEPKLGVQQDLVIRQGKPTTDEVVQEEWWGKQINTDHPSQPHGFGIGEMLTGGTSEGEATPEDASVSVYSGTSKSTSNEPWKLVQKRKLGSKQMPAENT